jgi:hypothetical protein
VDTQVAEYWQSDETVQGLKNEVSLADVIQNIGKDVTDLEAIR